MKTKNAADIIFAVFFTIMLLLTLFAEDLYCLTLPKVAVEAVERRGFPDGTIEVDGEVYDKWRTVPAVPKAALRGDFGDMVYAVNDTEDGTFLVEYYIVTGEEAEGYVEVKSGIFTKTKVVVGSDRDIYGGQRVMLTEMNESVALHTARERGEDITSHATVMGNRLKIDILCVVGAVLATVGAVVLCNRFCKGRWRFAKVPVLILWCILVCLFLRATVLLPGEWIPDKLIDWNGWKANMERFPLRRK